MDHFFVLGVLVLGGSARLEAVVNDAVDPV